VLFRSLTLILAGPFLDQYSDRFADDNVELLSR